MKKVAFLLALFAITISSYAQQGYYKYGLPTVVAGGDTIENPWIRSFIKTDTAIYCNMINPPGLGVWVDQDFEYHLLTDINPDEIGTAKEIFAYNNQVYLMGRENIYKYSNNNLDSITYPFNNFGYTNYPNSFFDEDNFYIFADFSLYVYSDTVWEEYPILDLNYNPNYYHFTFLALNGLDCYFGTPDGLLHFNNGNLILVDTMITGIYGYDQDNKLWVFRRDNGLGNIFNSNYTPFNSIYSNTDLQDFRTTSPHEMYFGTNGNHIIHLGHDVILSFDNELWYFKYLVKNYSFLAFPDENEIWYRDSYDTITCIHTDELNFFATGIDNMYQYRNYKILDINNMSAPYHTWGNLYSIYSMYSGLNWPKDSLSDISADMGLLVGGLDSDQKIHLSTVRNRTHGCDFYPGPLDTTNATTDTATAFQYDRIWSVKQSEIELFIQKYNSGTLTGTWYKIPKDILEWPAAGSGNISRKLAPFIDNNADGVYNPYDGDYPDIEGNEMLWWVYNDNFAENTVTDARTLGIEIQARAWAFNHDFSVDSLKILNNCNFIHYDIINRSDTTYYDTYLGIYDYGCLPSDYGYNNYDIYAGCNVESASMYHYNFYPDSVYEQSTKMVEWISFLNGPLADENDGIDNDHDFDVDEPGETITMSAYVPSYCCPPIQPSCQQFTKEHYYNYLQGKRFNGEAFYYFDDYHVSADTSSQVITKYVFPDDSNPNGWGQNGIAMPPWNESGNWMDTRINFGSLGPFTFYPGQKVSLDIVIGASWSDTTDLSAGAFQSDIENIRSWFADGIIPIGIEEQADNKKPENNSGFMIYPNPVAGESITLDCSNPSNEKARYIIFDSQGRQIKSGILTNGHRQKISVDGLEKGAYLIKLRGTHVNDQALFIKM